MELHLQTRNILGKKVKRLRREGLIPAELYGRDITNRHISINENEFEKVYKAAGVHTVVTAVSDNGEKIPVIIASVIRHPLTQKFLAVDLHQVRMDKEIHAKIPIEFVGEAPAVKKGYLVVKVVNELEAKALPKDLPHKISISLDKLEGLHQSITVKDCGLPRSVNPLVPEDTVLVTITEKMAEEAQPPLAEEMPAEAVAEPAKET